jgi:hypothetical protein
LSNRLQRYKNNWLFAREWSLIYVEGMPLTGRKPYLNRG